MPVGISIFSLSQPLNTILVVRPIRKAQINLIIYSSRPFFLSIYRSLLYNIQLNIPLISRLSIDTIYPRRVYYAAQTLEVIREIANRVNRFFFIPICVYSSSPYASTASYIRSMSRIDLVVANKLDCQLLTVLSTLTRNGLRRLTRKQKQVQGRGRRYQGCRSTCVSVIGLPRAIVLRGSPITIRNEGPLKGQAYKLRDPLPLGY